MTDHSSPENADALPCPFCGGTTKTRLYGGDGLFFIRCQTCPAEMRGFDQCAQDAIDAWNMRSFHHAQGAANPFPCPYNIDGCVLENSEIGPCLCALTSPEYESQAKATEGKAGTAGGDHAPVRRSTAGTGLRVGEASAVLPATSEIMDVTARRDGTTIQPQRMPERDAVVRRAIELADYVRPNNRQHITEVNLIKAVDALTPTDDPPHREPDAWEWRACIGGKWGAWLYLDQPVERFCDRNKFNLDNGSYELRPLYALTRPECGDAT